jgi:protein O-mannosyl-transferase
LSEEEPTRDARSDAWTWVALAVVALVHITYVPNGFTWLDHGDIEAGRAIPENVRDLFLRPFGDTGFYRPLVSLTLGLDRALYGTQAWGFHLTNLLLHVVACAAFARLIQGWGLTSGQWRAAAVLIAGVHATSWLPVGSISYRPELLAATFTLLAVSNFEKERPWSTAGWFLLGLMSKESVAFWVPALIALQEIRRHDTQRIVERISPSTVALGAWFLLRTNAVDTVWRSSWPTMPLSDAVATRLLLLWKQLVHVVSPIPAGLSDAVKIVGPGDIAVLAGALAAALGVLVVARRGLDDPWSRMLLFMAVALAPSLNLLALPRATSPHYAYLATFGVGIAGALIARTPGRLQTVRVSAVLIWTLATCTSTVLGGSRFETDETLFDPEVVADDRFREGWAYLGDAYRDQDKLGEAEAAYLNALSPQPNVLAYVDAAAVTVNLAEIYLRTGRDSTALALLEAVSQDARGETGNKIHYNRALIHARRGEHGRVVELLGDTQFNQVEPLMLLARSLGTIGRSEEALQTLARVRPMLDAGQRTRLDAFIKGTK